MISLFPDQDEQWKWWKCVPGIKAYFIQPGLLQVFWDLPHPEFRSLLKGYKVRASRIRAVNAMIFLLKLRKIRERNIRLVGLIECLPKFSDIWIKSLSSLTGLISGLFYSAHSTSSLFQICLVLQLFLNDVSYCEMFPPNYNSVTVSGMAGETLYEVYLEAYPADQMYLPHKSNKLVSGRESRRYKNSS